MEQNEFTESVKRTESPNFFIDKIDPRFFHGVLGIATESAELLDIVKKTIFYGKTVDNVHIQEELGDLAYYLFLTLDAMGADWNEVMERNVKKLQTRYPDKFTNDCAINRNIKKERQALQGH
jgi:NTP pyrophosphatase (non-canonical NTP hydrolase)